LTGQARDALTALGSFPLLTPPRDLPFVDPSWQETDFTNAVADLFPRGWQFPFLFSTGYPADAAAHTPGPARCPTVPGPFPNF
jgi:hypothetical protein